MVSISVVFYKNEYNFTKVIQGETKCSQANFCLFESSMLSMHAARYSWIGAWWNVLFQIIFIPETKRKMRIYNYLRKKQRFMDGKVFQEARVSRCIFYNRTSSGIFFTKNRNKSIDFYDRLVWSVSNWDNFGRTKELSFKRNGSLVNKV